MDADDNTAVKRYRRRREKGFQTTEPLMNSVKRLGAVVEVGLKQNKTVDIYEKYFDDNIEDHSSVPPSARGMALLKDPSDVKRTVTCIDWQHEGASRIAVSYGIGKFQDPRLMTKTLSVMSYVWDTQKPNSPESAVEPSSPLLSLRFNPKNPDTLIGGSYNGLVSFFDRRKNRNTPCATSVIERSHHDPVYDVRWSQSKTGTLCCSSSTDGRLLWWDTRRLSEPHDSVVIADVDDKTYGVSSMAWSPDGGSHKYLLGTEQGVVATLNARNRKGPSGGVSFTSKSGKHHGPIYSIERNPFLPRYFMTVGDWTARMWTEDLRSPIMTTKYVSSGVTAGSWSPTRPGVFVVTRKDGMMDVWDYFSKQNEVAFSYKVGDATLSSVSFSRGHASQMISVGDESGTVSLLELSESLTAPQSNERQAMSGMFQREMLREKNLIAMEKEASRSRARMNRAKLSASDTKKATAEEQESLLQIESDFLRLISKNEERRTRSEDLK